MKEILIIFQIILTFLLVGAILLQSKGTGLGQAWGGAGEFYRSKRGVEKLLFRLTIAVVVLFFICSVLISLF